MLNLLNTYLSYLLTLVILQKLLHLHKFNLLMPEFFSFVLCFCSLFIYFAIISGYATATADANYCYPQT